MWGDLKLEEKIKDIVIDKIVDDLLDVIANTSKEEIKHVLEKNKLQKILYKTIIAFTKSMYFKREYKNIIYNDNKDVIFSIPDDKIHASKTPKQLAENILYIIQDCFPSDDIESQNKISYDIAFMYLQRAKVTIDLYDIIHMQQNGFNQMTDDLSEIKNIILSNHKYELDLRQEKETLLRKELQNEVVGFIGEIMRRYILFVTKEPAKLSKEEMDNFEKGLISKIKSTIKEIDKYITEDFCIKPVEVLIVNGLQSEKKYINYFVFSECCFRNYVLDRTKKLLDYKDIMDLETYVVILRLRNKFQSNLFIPLIEMGQTKILMVNNIKIDESFFKREISEIGNLIILLYRQLCQL